jgi:OmpA-OmpF porin, OOP family
MMPATRLRIRPLRAGSILIGSAVLLTACAGRNTESLEQARAAVSQARADQMVVVRAPGKLEEAEQALTQTEAAFESRSAQVELDHLAYLTQQRAAIAVATAEEREALAEGDELMLDTRDRQIESLQDELAALQAEQTARGLVVTLGDILFNVDEAELTPGGELQVARLADALRQMPDRNVLIEGHADSSGTDAYNLDLSQRRARTVESLLLVQGVDPTRLVTRGYGEGYPVASNAAAAGRQQNRRVEVVILEPGAPSVPRS